MPQLNGLELFKKMKEINRSSKLMLLTASHEQLETNSGQLEFKVVRKPVKITDFLQEINAILTTDDKSQQIVNTTTRMYDPWAAATVTDSREYCKNMT